MGEQGLHFHNLSIGYHAKGCIRYVARGLEGSLKEGKLTCLVGRNGSGKSTLLRTLEGIQAPLEGELLLGERPLVQFSRTELARRIGVVLTEQIPTASLTVYDVVSMGRMPYTGFWGRLKVTDRKAVSAALEKVGMAEQAYRRFYELSDGERQKVLIARVVAQQTDIMLLDEPLAYLDYSGKIAVLKLLCSLAQENHVAVLLSIHDLELAARMADCIWKLEDGGLRLIENADHSMSEELKILMSEQ